MSSVALINTMLWYINETNTNVDKYHQAFRKAFRDASSFISCISIRQMGPIVSKTDCQ